MMKYFPHRLHFRKRDFRMPFRNGFLWPPSAGAFERGGVDLIDGYKLSAIEHRPVVERTGQRFCLFERVHMDEPRGEPRALPPRPDAPFSCG